MQCLKTTRDTTLSLTTYFSYKMSFFITKAVPTA